MRRLPILPTLIVAAAVAVMIGLGVWQLRRAGEKEALLARYAAAATLPQIAWPTMPTGDGALLFRRAAGFCREVVGVAARAGRNLAGESGWRHVAECRTGGAEGPGMLVDIGWSNAASLPAPWRGGRVTGVITSGRGGRLMLVADRAAPGLLASAPPRPAEIPNNHRAYAVQWFLFAAAAAVIYAVALRRRRG